MRTPSIGRNPTPGTWAVFLGLLAIVVLAWGGVLTGSFQYDDFPNLLNDPATSGGAALEERLLRGVRPLTRLTHVLDRGLWNDWAGGWLLLNLLLHGATVMGIYLLSRRSGASTTVCAMAAAVFALQPAHGMTVAYASGRAAGLMTALLTAALLAHEQGVRARPGWKRELWRGGAVFLFVLACLAKETALCFPLLLILWEACRPRRSDAAGCMLQSLWPYVLAMLIMMGAVLANHRYGQLLSYSMALRSPWESLQFNLTALPATATLLLRPWDLSVLHPAPSLTSWLWPGMLCAWLGMAFVSWRRNPWITLGMLWPIVALLPSHSVIAKADAVSESGLYLCWMGPCLAMAGAATARRKEEQSGNGEQRGKEAKRGIDRQGGEGGQGAEGGSSGEVRVRRFAGASAVLLTLVLLCAWRTSVWGDPVRLWREAVAMQPQSARAWNNLGMAYFAKSDVAPARDAFNRALRIDPRHVEALRNRQLLELVN